LSHTAANNTNQAHYTVSGTAPTDMQYEIHSTCHFNWQNTVHNRCDACLRI